MRGPLDLSRELLEAEVLHEFVHLRRRIDDAGELPDVLGVAPAMCVVVRLFDTGDTLVAVLSPAQHAIDPTAIVAAVGARTLQPADPARVSEVTDCHPSLVTPVGLPASIRTVADVRLAGQEIVFTATGDGSTALKIRTADLLALTGASLAPLVAPAAMLDVTPRNADGEWRGLASDVSASIR